MASIKRRADRGGRWQATVKVEGGKERARLFDRRTDAERWVTSIEHSKLVGNYVDPRAGKATFKSYAEEWRKVQPHRHSTAVSVEQDLRLHIYPSLGARPIGAVRPSEVQAMVTGLSSKLAPATLERVLSRATSVFRAAIKDRVITVTPCDDIRLPRSGAPSRGEVTEVLTTLQVVALSDAMPARYQALVIAGAGLGMRPGELFGLALDRIDFLRRTVKVDQQMVRVRGEGVRSGPLKTEASYRTLPLPETIADVIAGHLTAYPCDGHGLVFTNERGTPIQQHPFSVVWAAARGRANLPEWATPHDMRHHYASLLIRAGASVKVVQARLGHSSAKTTLDIYSHLFPDEEDRTRVAVDSAFGGIAVQPRQHHAE